MSNPMRLIAENLACERGGRLVFSNVSFELHAGEMMDLRGPNGAGKSSLLRLLAGLNTAAAGRIVLENGKSSASLAEQSHYVGHDEANKPALTVSQNLQFWAQFLGGTETILPLGAFNLTGLKNDQALLLSAGQKRRLALTRLLLAKRSLWLLDEPSVGLDSESLDKLRKVITSHLQEGGMVIAATHAELGVKAVRQLQLGKSA
jgi:heme exporter protein A